MKGIKIVNMWMVKFIYKILIEKKSYENGIKKLYVSIYVYFICM